MTLFFVMILTVFMLTVMITDFTRFIIPNKLVLALLAVYPVIAFTYGRPEWYYDIGIGFAMFLVGFVLFSMRVMGGGDVKLLAVCAVFVGKDLILPYFMAVALWGGALAIFLLIARELAPFICLKLGKSAESIMRVFTPGQPIPYGIAIAIAFLFLLWGGELPGLKL